VMGGTGHMKPHPFDMHNLMFILHHTCNSLLLAVAPNFNVQASEQPTYNIC
jgi:hypothetical protein